VTNNETETGGASKVDSAYRDEARDNGLQGDEIAERQAQRAADKPWAGGYVHHDGPAIPG
jgi:hypothetical protein